MRWAVRVNPLGGNPIKWVKHNQTICRLLPINCLGVFDQFVGLVLTGLNNCKRLTYLFPDCFRNKNMNNQPFLDSHFWY